MKKKFLFRFSIIVILVLGFMILSNPTKEEYSSWAKEKKMEQSNDALERAFNSFLGKAYVDSSTTRKNYILFSIFTTYDTDNAKKVTIGVFKNFIFLGKQNNSASKNK